MPPLKLLVEWEPRGRVFLENLMDLALRRQLPPIRITARPARFWGDVFVATGLPWTSFLEAMLWHLLLLILFIWGQSRIWTPIERFQSRRALQGSITYYPPTPSFRATESRAPSVRARAKRAAANRASAHQAAMPVMPEQRPSIVTPPDIKQATARLPNLVGSHAVTPMMPFSATEGMRRNRSAEAMGAVAPAPQVEAERDRRAVVPQATVVAPAPELAASSTGRTVRAASTDGARVVPPPPAVPGADKGTRVSAIAGAGSQVVPPPPSAQTSNSTRVGRLNSWSGAGTNVVPPAPTIHGTGKPAGDGRVSAMAGAGSQVVPPPPSAPGAGSSARAGRVGSLSGSGAQAVPPAPAVQSSSAGSTRLRAAGAGAGVVPPPASVENAGSAGASGRLGSLPGNGSTVVPPAPAVSGADGGAGAARAGALSGAGVVPPPAAVENAGGGGRLASLQGDGSPVGSLSTSVQASGNAGGGGPLQPMDPLPVEAKPSGEPGNNAANTTIEELPLGLLGVVFSVPGTSYFSNFEVFVAKRRVGKELQLIKLVYEFLPYQRRLSEYDLDNMPPRIIKLKVTPDPSCNESLGEMLQPPTDPSRPVTEYPSLPAALRAADMNAVLPCFRTTAEDFQKAMLRGR